MEDKLALACRRPPKALPGVPAGLTFPSSTSVPASTIQIVSLGERGEGQSPR